MSRIHRMSRGRKALLSLLLVGVIGTVAGVGTYSAFSATTVNPGNTFAAGTVVISDNDANAAMYTHRERDADGRRHALHPRDLHGDAPVDGQALHEPRRSARSARSWTW